MKVKERRMSTVRTVVNRTGQWILAAAAIVYDFLVMVFDQEQRVLVQAIDAAVSRTLQRLIAPEAASCFTCKTLVLDEHQRMLMAEMMDFHCKIEEQDLVKFDPGLVV
ncbi:hypothetical protein V6N13_101528 [Hibiscus sabdariffa]